MTLFGIWNTCSTKTKTRPVQISECTLRTVWLVMPREGKEGLSVIWLSITMNSLVSMYRNIQIPCHWLLFSP
uniref:Uncharacterized protein n=1 Tax=Anguilla anguilla TaxID=7936 RepID=A0A0E9SKV2_ANGAN